MTPREILLETSVELNSITSPAAAFVIAWFNDPAAVPVAEVTTTVPSRPLKVSMDARAKGIAASMAPLCTSSVQFWPAALPVSSPDTATSAPVSRWTVWTNSRPACPAPTLQA